MKKDLWNGQVLKDVDAFSQIKERLESNPGQLMKMAKKNGSQPFWGVSRMLFPVAESLAALQYPSTSSTSSRLLNLFDNELSEIRPEYKDFSGLIILTWRHGLTHADEPPSIVIGRGRIASWHLGIDEGADNHLKIVTFDRNASPRKLHYGFNLKIFYDDLISLCTRLGKSCRQNGTSRAKIYNSWFEKRIPLRDPSVKKTTVSSSRLSMVEKKARKEVLALLS